MIHKAADQGVSDQACRGDAGVDDLWLDGFLHQDLAALASPLASNVAVHEELGGDDVQAFADVFTDALHRLGAIKRRAQGALGLVVVFHAHQVFGQRLALRLAACIPNIPSGCAAGAGLSLQRIQLSLQAGLVGGHSLFEQLTLLGVHGLGARSKLPCLQTG